MFVFDSSNFKDIDPVSILFSFPVKTYLHAEYDTPVIKSNNATSSDIVITFFFFSFGVLAILLFLEPPP